MWFKKKLCERFENISKLVQRYKMRQKGRGKMVISSTPLLCCIVHVASRSFFHSWLENIRWHIGEKFFLYHRLFDVLLNCDSWMGARLSGHWQDLLKVAYSHFSREEIFCCIKATWPHFRSWPLSPFLKYVPRGPRRAVLVADPRCREAGRVARYARRRDARIYTSWRMWKRH